MIEPRKVLEVFGVCLHEKVQVRVWDSTAEIRYLVLPMLPDGYKGFSEQELIGIVSRDAMIGTGLIGLGK